MSIAAARETRMHCFVSPDIGRSIRATSLASQRRRSHSERRSTFSRRHASEVLPDVCPSEDRGRRESRVSDAPAAACASKSTRVSNHRFTGIIRPSLRNGFNGFLRALPGDEFLFVTVVSRIERLHAPGRAAKPPRDLTPATGARTTRLLRPRPCRSSRALPIAHGSRRSALQSCRAHDTLASTASHPNVRDDRDTPLVKG